MRCKSLLFSLLALFAVSCDGDKQTNEAGMKNPPEHVILIGFDGLSAYRIATDANMPTYRELMENGSYTLENRSVLPSSSAVNWASMFMGAGPELHGFTEWGSQKPELPSRVVTEHNLFPDIYFQLRQKFPQAELGFFYEWDGMKYLVDTLSINRVESVTLSAPDTQSALAPVVKYIKEEKPMFCSVIFAEPDGVGHGIGWESDEYGKMVEHLDNGIAEIVKAVEEAGMSDETIFILAADHGGTGTGHGGKTMKEMQTAIVFNGKGIKKGFNITESTMVYDIASTIGYILGIDQPQVWTGRPIMSVFE